NLYATGTQVALDLAGGIVAARADDAAARMRGGAAEIQPTDRRAVVGVSRQWTREKQLVQRHRALENVAARETELALEIEWRQHLTVDDRAFQVRSVLGE